MKKNKEYFIKLGKRIRQLRLAKKLTQADLAAKIGKDYQSIQRVERGDINPSIFYLQEIANGLEVDISELFEWIGDLKNGGVKD